MSSTNMRVISVINQGGQYNLIGDGANPSLKGVTVTLDSQPPPDPDKARGTYQPPYANVYAGSQTWGTLLTRVGHVPFQVTLVYTGSNVTDLNFPSSIARDADRDVEVLAMREELQQIRALLEERALGERNGAADRHA
jgi:hypothetical protein